jgi:hypothetical protein
MSDAVDIPVELRWRRPGFFVYLDLHIPLHDLAFPFFPRDVGSEVKRLPVVVFVCSPGDAERLQAIEEVLGQGRNGRAGLPVGYFDSEVANRRIIVRCHSEHDMAFVVDLLAGPNDGIARSRGFVKLNEAVFVCLDDEDELVNLVASLGGELEWVTTVLNVQGSRWGDHDDF